MLFSTTDRRGVIQRANDVFSRIAQHPLAVLIGAPHNIVRHPGMPGGVFRILWHAIQAGEATGAYVLNRAADGSGYWTLTSISPAGERYISVRTRPMREELLAFTWNIYQDARSRERAARADGVTAAQAAQLGEARILERLAQRGFPSYRAFLHQLLPAEAEARIAAIGELAAPGGQGDRALLPVRAAVAEIERSMRELVLALAASHEHASELSSSVTGAERAIRDLGDSLRSLGEEIEVMGRDRVPMLIDAGAPLRERCMAVDESVRRVAGRAGEPAVQRGHGAHAGRDDAARR